MGRLWSVPGDFLPLINVQFIFGGPGAPFPVNTFCHQSRKSVQLVPRNKYFFHPHIKSYKSLTERGGGESGADPVFKSLCHSGA